MRTVFKIAMFTLFLNIAASIISFSMPLDDAAMSHIKPIEEEDQGQQMLQDGVEGNATLPGATGSDFNVREILLDTFLIGHIIRLADGIGTIIYGLPEMLYDTALLFTPDEDPQEYLNFLDSFRETLNYIISFAYGIGIFLLWTNRDISR